MRGLVRGTFVLSFAIAAACSSFGGDEGVRGNDAGPDVAHDADVAPGSCRVVDRVPGFVTVVDALDRPDGFFLNEVVVQGIAPDIAGSGVWIGGTAGNVGLRVNGTTLRGGVVAHLAGDGSVNLVNTLSPSGADGFAYVPGIVPERNDVYYPVVFNTTVTVGTTSYVSASGVESLVARGTQSAYSVFGPSSTAIWGVAPALGEGVYVAGDWSNTLQVRAPDGAVIITKSSTSRELFVLRFYGGASSADAVAVTSIAADAHVGGVASDAGRNVYIAGRYTGANIPFSTGQPATGSDAFVASLTPELASRWSIPLGGIGGQEVRAITAINEGGAFVTGTFDATFATPGDSAVPGKGDTDIFVVRLDGNGKVVWKSTFGGAGADWASSIAYDATCGRVVIAGRTASGDFDPGGGVVPGDGTRHFLLFLDAQTGAFAGQLVSTAFLGDARVAVDSFARVYWAAPFAGEFDLQGKKVAATAPAALFVARLDRPN
jgi:hypothetical protein